VNYTVSWTQQAEDDLARAWLAAEDRNAVTAASNTLDRALASDPYALGIPIGTPQIRTASEPPLAIDFEIIEDDKKVRVLRVWSVF
jgi:plasmid stabilization system protein ParE